MAYLLRLLAWCLILVCFWSGVGCSVRAVRLRYAPLVGLSLFFVLFGWTIGMLFGFPALPRWSMGAAFLALSVYRWSMQRWPASVPIQRRHILVWWTRRSP